MPIFGAAMIFYGDRWRSERPQQLLGGIGATLAVVARTAPGLERRAELVRLLLEAGELAQGLADANFHARGCDDLGPIERRCAELTLESARALASEVAGREVTLDGIERTLDALAREALPERVRVNAAPEGYAFYSLYPELYLEAATAMRSDFSGEVVVLGLRSIGASLAAVVAAGVGAALPPVTLRPVGHPFQRELRLSPELERLLLSVPGALYAIVDEGPGLSGSSFGAAADWLEDHGVAPERLHFFPGHRNDLGPQASERHRQRWARARRHVRDFDPSFLANNGAALEDIAAGRWRARVYTSEHDWPPADLINERRKYLYRAQGRTWLAKFAGLGRHGEEKLARARVLERAGLHPPIRRLRHGYLVTEWLTDARPLGSGEDGDRAQLLQTVGDYLGLIVRELPARAGAQGAPPERLLEMARFNAGKLLGDELASALDRWREHLPSLSARLRPVATDNRMHAWEWLRLPEGRLFKTDALDHHGGPDLIGEQDIAWDVAGATIELGLSPAEQELLLQRLGRHAPRPDTLQFHVECYLAFQLGAYAMAAWAIQGFDPAEAARLTAARDRYARQLRILLAQAPGSMSTCSYKSQYPQ